ncbi:MAG: ABC transporter substrate-binding protein [Acidimicrobiales bacterium]
MDRRTFLLSGLGAAGALAVASCSKSSKNSSPGPGASTDVNRPSPRPTIRQSGSIDFGNPNPFNYFAAPGYQNMIFIYDTLLQEDVDGKVLPLIAEAYTPSSDGLTHTFQIRDGIKWHDGQPLTVDDVVFTYDYFRSQTLAPQVIAKPDNVAAARAVDARTVEIRLDKPIVTFARNVAGQIPIVPKHIWSSIADAKAAQGTDVLVGCGPYRLESHTAGEGTYLYSAFDGYFLGRPFVKRVEFRPVSDDLTALQAGEIDSGGTDVFGTPSDAVAPFRNNPAFAVQVAKANITIPMKWNIGAGGALADPRFRQACARAIDRNDIVARVAGGNGAPGNPGYLAPGNEYYVPVEQYPFDVAAANRMLDDAGYTRSGSGNRQGPDGKPLSYTLTVVDSIPAVLELVLASLAKIGLNLTPKRVPLPTVLGGASYDIVVAFDGGFGAKGDPDHLRDVYSSQSTAFQHPLGYRNPQVDNLAERQAVSLDVNARKAVVADLQRAVAQDLPVLPIYYPDGFSIYRKSTFDQWSDGTALTEPKRNLMTGMKSGLKIRPIAG